MTKGFVDAPGGFDIGTILAEREPERYALHTAHMNEQMVRVLQTIGYDVGFRAGQGQYLFDRKGDRYLDLLSGWGVFAIGRNHPTVRDALKAVLGSDLPNLIQMDVSVLSGVLAERLLAYTPWLDKVFFSNSGAEAVEAAIKFARCATGRPDIAYADHAFHGLSYGALSLTGDRMFRDGFGTLLPGCVEVPFNDLAALERKLAGKQVAAFIVEPIQGKGVNIPDDDYLAGAQALCRKYGTLFVCDEIQTGLGRTGKFFALEHWGVEPDMVLVAKALSGGHVPVGAVLTTKRVFDKVFSRMDKAVVHGSTFAKNDMAMAAGLATLEVIEREGLVANAAAKGDRLMAAFREMAERWEFVKTVRGKGLMIGLEFGSPKSLKLKAAWSLLETANAGLFSQIITIPIFKNHKIVVQVAGHGLNVVKLLPPLTITDADCDWIESAFEDVIADAHKVPGSVWTLGKTLATHAMKARAGA
ncbi:Aminotransferase class-III [Beijerinckiaceae bacterium RH AL1]|nr:aspartate aminotransferase family protein [Beijerinckiaceae bacterium]VVB46766.1 Aminotransferase class-III [Beijerinckiaceae bacterium RH CH11]VVB46849.1 Aminotransferase class-III [Beijerinckiaceae bacterium RH AL8]VVC55548.1 Aminotransferase class-III [Beijerinckiaceae bacterium RH AL1]